MALPIPSCLIPKCPICANQMTAHSCMDTAICSCGFEVDGQTITRARGQTPEATQDYLKKHGRFMLRVTGTISHTLASPNSENRYIVFNGTPVQTPTGSMRELIDRVRERATPTVRMRETSWPVDEDMDLVRRLCDTSIDPLDVKYDGCTLRDLLYSGQRDNRETLCERPVSYFPRSCWTPEQRAAVSAHWSAELRAKVAASKERERHQVMMQIDADDL